MMKYQLVRIGSGIPGLDGMTQGGLPFPSTILVAGPAGTGKTTLALQFLAQGAREGETGLFISTLSESVQWMLRFTSNLSFLKKEYFGDTIVYDDFSGLIKSAKDYRDVLHALEEKLTTLMPQRVVIDSVTVFERFKTDYRDLLYDLSVLLKDVQAATILTGEVDPTEPYPVEVAHVVDSVLLLTSSLTTEGGRNRHLEVLKMRGTNHVTGRHLMAIDRNGITVQVGMG